MKVGTKSLLYGAHCFFVHPWFVAWAWWKLYGFPRDPRLWIMFVIHDWGYWGKPNMDGPEGEDHVWWAAHVMGRLFGWRWFLECLYHSRFWVKKAHASRDRDGVEYQTWRTVFSSLMRYGFLREDQGIPPCAPSRLCMADKLAISLTPGWLYLPMVRATGEIREYRKLAASRLAQGEPHRKQVAATTDEQWWRETQAYCRGWVEAHKDGSPDTWTPDVRKAHSSSGVWS